MFHYFYLIHTDVTGGSFNLCPGISFQFIVKAPLSPGEQGIIKSCSITLGLLIEGPETFRKYSLTLKYFILDKI